ncbi:MAG: hypothetical protein WBN04_03600 [Paracoccaceae bacterium]
MQRILRLNLILALITALAGTAFAHRAPSPDLDRMVASYIAIGGSFDDLCGDPLAPGKGGCEACRLVGAATLPPMSDIAHRLATSRDADQPSGPALPDAGLVRDPGRWARAPPFV